MTVSIKRSFARNTLSGTNLTRAGDYNQRVVLQAIRANIEITRVELAGITGLTQQSIINISRRLISEGLVVEIGKRQGSRGQPATWLSINPEGAFAVGLNIDRDHMTFVVMDFGGKVHERIYSDRLFALPMDVLDFLKTSLERTFENRRLKKNRLLGIGLAIPDRLSGVNVPERPVAYDQWASVDIAGLVSAELRLPVFVENDSSSAAIGELQFGQGRHHATFIYTLISAGLGCGLIINGQPYSGSLTHAGEIGNVPISLEDGTKQSLWDIVSLYALYRELSKAGFSVSHPDELSPNDEKMMFVIDKWVEAAARHMTEPFLAITYLLSPEIHFIGGQLPTFIAEKLCACLNDKLLSHQSTVPLARFKVASTSKDAAALGAASVVFQKQLLPSLAALNTI